MIPMLRHHPGERHEPIHYCVICKVDEPCARDAVTHVTNRCRECAGRRGGD